MEDWPRIVGRCTELVDERECGGNLIENIVHKDWSGKTLSLGNLIGYVCDKNPNHQKPLIDIGDQINSLIR